MTKTVFLLITITMVLGGCVSNKTHKIALDESETRRIQLENTREENENRKKELASLQAKVEELSSKNDMASREIKTLKQENESLSSSLKQKTEEITILTKDRDSLTGENETLRIKTGKLSSDKEKELANVRNTYDNLVREMKKEIEKGDIKITQAVDRLSVNLVEKILFDSGKAEVKPEGLNILKRVGDILKSVTDKQIRVEGHTDNVPIGARIREKYSSNWELSTSRATNVVRYLQESVGIDPVMLSAAGFSEYRPAVTNDTPENRAQNRRIEIALLPLDIDRVLEELKR